VHQCSLHAQSLIEVDTWLAFYRPFWADTLDALAQFVEENR
jgi:hypothetical protein